MMSRLSRLIPVLIVIGGAFGLYKVKYWVQALQTEAANLTQQLDEERDALHVVSAEWAYLNRPERLQVLTRKYLSLAPVSSAQVAEIESVPMRPEPEEATVTPAVARSGSETEESQ